MSKINIVMGQLNFLVGDIKGNTQRVIEKAIYAKDTLHADMIIFPELTLTGYPPEDLLFQDDIYEIIDYSLELIKNKVKGIAIIIGFPQKKGAKIYNKAICFYNGETLTNYAKQKLPNYKVFDEKRYFVRGHQPALFNFKGIKIGLMICEDLWYPGPLRGIKKEGAELVISINASPFNEEQAKTRENLLSVQTHQNKLPIIYVNLVGGQDELVFDGGSLAINANSKLAVEASYFKEELVALTCKKDSKNQVTILEQPLPSPLSQYEKIYQALVLGVRDYVKKNGFKGALLGLSGGIDSALATAIAVDALGANHVTAVMMPSKYNAPISLEDAISEANLLKIKYHILPIDKVFNTFLEILSPIFKDKKPTLVEENLQARCRGILLMALSNYTGNIVLTANNKSEMAVGYTTLYGDMCGGFAILKDVSKTLVYQLTKYRNSLFPVIPNRVIERPPSAELRENQKDEDSLPPYHDLDPLIKAYIEEDKGPTSIVKSGFDSKLTKEIIRLININEYKRRQSPPGIRITPRAFGKDRRYPITAKYNETE